MDQKTVLEIKKFEIKNPTKKLPVNIFFSNGSKISQLEKILKHLPKKSAIIIREYHLKEEEREMLARKIITLAKPLGVKVLIGKNLQLAQKVRADGVHFSDYDTLPIFNIKRFAKRFIVSFSCHGLTSILKAQKLQFDIIFISPIFPTTSHPNATTIGLRKLTEITLKTKRQPYYHSSFYALGGINLHNISSIRKSGLHGFGAISLFLTHQ